MKIESSAEPQAAVLTANFPIVVGPVARRVLYLVGTLLFLISIVFVAQFAAHNWPTVSGRIHVDASVLVLVATLYALTHFSSPAAWVVVLWFMGQRIPLWKGVCINLVAQIGKYLPGNIAHYVARAGLAVPTGTRLTKSGLATLVEVLATLMASVVVAGAALWIDPTPLAAIDQALADHTGFPVVAACVAVLVMIAILHRMRIPIRALFAATACLISSFILIGLSFYMLVAAIAPTELSLSAAIGVFSLAWVAGYLIPGAPAGLGVREGILVAWLSPLIGGPPALACVMLHRMLTAIIDAVVALFGYACLRYERLS